MTLFQAILLGIIQGITEFLPISSSAHLVITPFFLNWKIPSQDAFIFDVVVQLGTLVAVLAFFSHDLMVITRSLGKGIRLGQPFYNTQAKLGWLLILATIPAGLIGLLLKDWVEAAFNNVAATGFFLLITAVLLLLAEKFGRRTRKLEQLSWMDALWMGFFQAASIFPGISRSGSSIAGGLFRDLERTASARFSFLMSVPIMVLAGIAAIYDLIQTGQAIQQLPPLAAGFVTSALVGYLSIRWLLAYLNKNSLNWFALYCSVIGLLTLSMTGIRFYENRALPTLPPPPTPQTVRIALTPSLKPLAQTIYSCAEPLPGLAVFLEEIPLSQTNWSTYDMLISFGMPPRSTPFLYQLGFDTLNILVHPANPLKEISIKDLKAIYTGEISEWREIISSETYPFSIQVLNYPQDNDLEKVFREAVYSNQAHLSRALLVPNPQAMLETIAKQPNAIGYIPASWSVPQDAAKVVSMAPNAVEKFRRPILSSTALQPQGVLTALLDCLQPP